VGKSPVAEKAVRVVPNGPQRPFAAANDLPTAILARQLVDSQAIDGLIPGGAGIY